MEALSLERASFLYKNNIKNKLSFINCHGAGEKGHRKRKTAAARIDKIYKS